MDVSWFPPSIWDGDSSSRDSDDGENKAPDYLDWRRCVSEVASVQAFLMQVTGGINSDPIETIGTTPDTPGLSRTEHGTAAMHKTVFTLDDFEIPTTDGSVPSTNGAYGSALIYTFPPGYMKLVASSLSCKAGQIKAQTGGSVGLGDAADFDLGAGVIAATDQVGFGLDLIGDEDKIIPHAQIKLAAGVSNADEFALQGVDNGADGTAAAIQVFLNMRTLNDNDHGPLPDVLLVSGFVRLTWCIVGDI